MCIIFFEQVAVVDHCGYGSGHCIIDCTYGDGRIGVQMGMGRAKDTCTYTYIYISCGVVLIYTSHVASVSTTTHDINDALTDTLILSLQLNLLMIPPCLRRTRLVLAALDHTDEECQYPSKAII